MFYSNFFSKKIFKPLFFLLLFSLYPSVETFAKSLHSQEVFEFSSTQKLFNLLEKEDLRSYLFSKNSFELGEDLEISGGMKSKGKAILFSFFIPGSGHLYAESKTKGKMFLGVEAGLWLSFFAFRTYGSWLKKDYKNYAVLHAKVNLEGKFENEDFFEDLAAYLSRDEYNQFVRLYEGIDSPLYPEDDFWNWEWDSQSSLKKYREIRNRKRKAYRKALYMVGLSLANRVISAIDAVREVKKFNRKKVFGKSFSQIRLCANPLGKNPYIKIVFQKNF